MPLEVLQEKLAKVPEMYFGQVSDFLDAILEKKRQGEAEIPNATTREALREAEEMCRHPENYEWYDDVDKMLADAQV